MIITRQAVLHKMAGDMWYQTGVRW